MDYQMMGTGRQEQVVLPGVDVVRRFRETIARLATEIAALQLQVDVLTETLGPFADLKPSLMEWYADDEECFGRTALGMTRCVTMGEVRRAWRVLNGPDGGEPCA